MKLAEALILRRDLQTRVEQLRQRLTANALAQEGEAPAENPGELLTELSESTKKLEDLIARINLTNAGVRCGEKTLTELLAAREAMTLRISVMQSLLEAASRQVMRGTRTEVKVHATVDVAALRKETDGLSRQLRELDTTIQAANWTTSLQPGINSSQA